MSGNAFIDPAERALRKLGPIPIRVIVWIKWHPVHPVVRVRIGKWPAIVRPVLHMDKLVGRMIVVIRRDHPTVVARLKWTAPDFGRVTDVVALIYDHPLFIGSSQKIKAFRVPDPGGYEFPVFPVQVIAIDCAPDGIASGVGWIRIGGRRNIDIKLMIRTDRDVL